MTQLQFQNFRWVTGDEVYGQDPVLRGWLAEQHVACKHRCGPRGQNARTVAAILPEHAWEIRSAGDGAHGLRAMVIAMTPVDMHRGCPLAHPVEPNSTKASGACRWLSSR